MEQSIDNVVDSPNMDTFKARLDKNWQRSDILFNYRAELEITVVAREINI